MPMKDQKKEFEKFYKKNIDRVYRYVFFRVGANKELAEDLVSEIFIKVLKNFNSYDENISQSAWVFTIAKNHLANYWRDKKPEVFFMENYNEDDAVNDVFLAKITDHNQERQFIKQEINEFLNLLEPEERENVTLHYLVGYNYSEIAEMKNSTESAIKVATHRAIKKIRQLKEKII